MPNPSEVKKIAETIQTLKDAIRNIKVELSSMGWIETGTETDDLATTIENTKLENEQLLKETEVLKNQIMELGREIKQTYEEKLAVEIEEVLLADDPPPPEEPPSETPAAPAAPAGPGDPAASTQATQPAQPPKDVKNTPKN